MSTINNCNRLSVKMVIVKIKTNYCILNALFAVSRYSNIYVRRIRERLYNIFSSLMVHLGICRNPKSIITASETLWF